MTQCAASTKQNVQQTGGAMGTPAGTGSFYHVSVLCLPPSMQPFQAGYTVVCARCAAGDMSGMYQRSQSCVSRHGFPCCLCCRWWGIGRWHLARTQGRRSLEHDSNIRRHCSQRPSHKLFLGKQIYHFLCVLSQHIIHQTVSVVLCSVVHTHTSFNSLSAPVLLLVALPTEVPH